MNSESVVVFEIRKKTVDQMLYGTKREDTVPNVKLPALAPLFP